VIKKLSIGVRIGLAFSLVTVLTVSTILPLNVSDTRAIIATAELRQLKGLFKNIKASIRMESRTAELMSSLVANIPDVQAAMAAGDRDRLYNLLGPSYKVLKNDYGIRQFQFHTPPATSFLRVHKPKKFGDDLSSFRKTVVQANTDRKPVIGIEKGVAGLGVRGMVPLHHAGSHIGSVEFGMSFGKPFFENFKNLYGVDLTLHVFRDGKFSAFATTLKDRDSLLNLSQLQSAYKGEIVNFEEEYDNVSTAVFAGVINDFSGKPIGVLEISMDRSQYAAALSESIKSNILIGVICIVLGIIVAIFVARAIVKPIKDTVIAMNDVAEGDGDLTRRLDTSGSKEISELADAFNRFAEKVRVLVTDVVGSTTQLATASEEMSAITSDANASITRQRSEIDQVATAMNEMTATVQEVARSADEAANSAKDADSEATQGKAVVNQVKASIVTLAGEVEHAAVVINNLQQDSESIGTVLDVIRGIAEQTNLLALNAAIEAARAGEQGRGFAVVADEVRTLASRTQQSTQEIQEMIEKLQTAALEAVDVMTGGKKQVVESVQYAESASQSLETITAAVEQIHNMNTHIAGAAEEQSSVSEEINKNVVNINTVADQVTHSASQTATAGAELAELATRLQAVVGHFKT